eukprot:15454361-Alexandrium_andersonii.AAC.1
MSASLVGSEMCIRDSTRAMLWAMTPCDVNCTGGLQGFSGHPQHTHAQMLRAGATCPDNCHFGQNQLSARAMADSGAPPAKKARVLPEPPTWGDREQGSSSQVDVKVEAGPAQDISLGTQPVDDT